MHRELRLVALAVCLLVTKPAVGGQSVAIDNLAIIRLIARVTAW